MPSLSSLQQLCEREGWWMSGQRSVAAESRRYEKGCMSEEQICTPAQYDAIVIASSD